MPGKCSLNSHFRSPDKGYPQWCNGSTVGAHTLSSLQGGCAHGKGDWESLVRPWKVKAPENVYRPVGCLECRNTGYLGRQGLYEILTINESVKPLINADADISALRLQAMKEGMRTLRLSGAQKVGAGTTSVEEVVRVAPEAGK